MQARRTYVGGTDRGDGFLDVRQRAYVEGLQRLSDRSSLASRLTKKQTEMIESDSPFEIFDQAHKALAKQHKENET